MTIIARKRRVARTNGGGHAPQNFPARSIV
jgi:hypothetical protein